MEKLNEIRASEVTLEVKDERTGPGRAAHAAR